jgi:hypothetical protein
MQTRINNKPVYPGQVYEVADHVDVSSAIRNGIIELVEEENAPKIQKKDIGQQVPVDTGPTDADDAIKAIVKEAEDFNFEDEEPKGKKGKE